MGAKSNLLIYLKKKNISRSKFYRITGLSNGYLDKNENISSNNLETIMTFFVDLNLYWLISGKGEMILNSSENTQHIVEEPAPKYAKMDLVAEYLVNRIKDLEKENAELKEKMKSTEK